MQALDKERREVAASTNNGRGSDSLLEHRVQNKLFFVSLETGKVVKQKSEGEKISKLKA